MAGLAIYLDPEDSIDVIKDYIDKNSTTIGVNALFDDNHDHNDTSNITTPEVLHKNATEGNITKVETTTVRSTTTMVTESSVIGDKDDYDQLLNLDRSDSWTSSMGSSSTFDQYSFKWIKVYFPCHKHTPSESCHLFEATLVKSKSLFKSVYKSACLIHSNFWGPSRSEFEIDLVCITCMWYYY